MGKIAYKENQEELVKEIMKGIKFEILKEFEKVCPTDMSFQRMKRTMHDIFDEGERQLKDM